MISSLNNLSKKNQSIELEKCCGSATWISEMSAACPFDNIETMHQRCDEIWSNCDENDYLEAFTHHPQIGDINALKMKFSNTSHWASNEQEGANHASEDVLHQLKQYNDDYLKKFGFIFIVCATGKTAQQMLDLLIERMPNNRQDEMQIAALEQNKITHLRLDKLLSTNT